MSEKEAKENCVFWKILAGKLPVSMIYEDEKTAVCVDLYPMNEGHLLIIPKIHAPYMKDVKVDLLQYMMKIAAKMNTALRESKFRCDGVNLFVADGEAAQQEVFHFHLHVYPRFFGDRSGFKYDRSKHFVEMEREKMEDITAELKQKMAL